MVPLSLTVFVVNRAGTVRAVFEGLQAWDAAVIEPAVRHLAVKKARNSLSQPPASAS
jgi:hypothetical protein